MKRQGERTDLTSAQFVPKLTAREQFAQEAGVNLMEITSYIRLTNLIDPLLKMVDEKKIALNAAVGLSYLGTKGTGRGSKFNRKGGGFTIYCTGCKNAAFFTEW